MERLNTAHIATMWLFFLPRRLCFYSLYLLSYLYRRLRNKLWVRFC